MGCLNDDESLDVISHATNQTSGRVLKHKSLAPPLVNWHPPLVFPPFSTVVSSDVCFSVIGRRFRSFEGTFAVLYLHRGYDRQLQPDLLSPWKDGSIGQ